MASSQAPTERDFIHSAVIVESDDDLRRILLPAIRRALFDADEVFLALGPETASVVRNEFGAEADQLHWGDSTAFYQRLGFSYSSFRKFLAHAFFDDRRVHVFAEPDVASGIDESSPVDRAAAYMAYEAVCNETYARFGCEVTCVWDARRHPTLTIANVRRLHSHELTTSGLHASATYVDPERYLAGRADLPLPLPESVDWTDVITDPDDVAGMRLELEHWARSHGFTAAGATDVVLAVNEVTTNALVHGKPPVQLSAWRHATTLVVQVDDHGGTALPPTAGYYVPDNGAEPGYGLWIARQLADVVQTNSAGDVTSVRLHFPYDLTHRNPPPAER